jgi:O-antigen/teichoic acid export membrane protein
MLLAMVQGAYLQPSLVRQLASADLEGRRDFLGGLVRVQKRGLMVFAAVAGLGLALGWGIGVIPSSLALLLLAAICAAVAATFREFFRMVLLAYRLPTRVLRVDIFYVALLLGGAYLATLVRLSSVAAALTLSLAAGVGAILLSRTARQHEGWNIHGVPGVLKKIAPIGGLAVLGAAIHWAYSQGYVYVVASTLDVTAVAALASTRLLMMPVNLMSSGMSSMTFPSVSHWLQKHSVRTVFHRLLLLSGGVAALGVVYLVVVWLMRDWIFAHIVKTKIEIPHRDTLLLIWSFTFVLMAIRDQMCLPASRGHFTGMTWLAFVTAVVSLSMSFVGTRLFGVIGALLGVLTGEIINVIGNVTLSWLEVKRSEREQAPAGSQVGQRSTALYR